MPLDVFAPFVEALYEELDKNDAKLEIGDEIPIVGKDCIVIFGMEPLPHGKKHLTIRCLMGEPITIDASMSSLMEKSNETEGAGE